MASAQVVETSVTNNSPSQDSNHPDDLFQSRYNKYNEYKDFHECEVDVHICAAFLEMSGMIVELTIGQTPHEKHWSLFCSLTW